MDRKALGERSTSESWKRSQRTLTDHSQRKAKAKGSIVARRAKESKDKRQGKSSFGKRGASSGKGKGSPRTGRLCLLCRVPHHTSERTKHYKQPVTHEHGQGYCKISSINMVKEIQHHDWHLCSPFRGHPSRWLCVCAGCVCAASLRVKGDLRQLVRFEQLAPRSTPALAKWHLTQRTVSKTVEFLVCKRNYAVYHEVLHVPLEHLNAIVIFWLECSWRGHTRTLGSGRRSPHSRGAQQDVAEDMCCGTVASKSTFSLWTSVRVQSCHI